MCPHARTPGCLATFDRLDVGTYSGRTGGQGQTRHGWAQDELERLQLRLQPRPREAHNKRATRHDGARDDTRTAGPIGLRVVATTWAPSWRACMLPHHASRPHVSAVCKDRPHIRPHSNVSVALWPLPSACGPGPIAETPAEALVADGSCKLDKAEKKCRVPSDCVLVPEGLRT